MNDSAQGDQNLAISGLRKCRPGFSWSEPAGAILSGKEDDKVAKRLQYRFDDLRYGHIGNQALRDAAEVLGGVKVLVDSLKKSAKSPDIENVFIQ